MKLPPTDHKHGYTETTVKEILGPDIFELFMNWMKGKTLTMNNNNENVYYVHDLEYFLRR